MSDERCRRPVNSMTGYDYLTERRDRKLIGICREWAESFETFCHDMRQQPGAPTALREFIYAYEQMFQDVLLRNEATADEADHAFDKLTSNLRTYFNAHPELDGTSEHRAFVKHFG